MDKLFELSAELTIDSAAFLQGLARAEQAAQAAAETLQRLQASAVASWSAVASLPTVSIPWPRCLLTL